VAEQKRGDDVFEYQIYSARTDEGKIKGVVVIVSSVPFLKECWGQLLFPAFQQDSQLRQRGWHSI